MQLYIIQVSKESGKVRSSYMISSHCCVTKWRKLRRQILDREAECYLQKMSRRVPASPGRASFAYWWNFHSRACVLECQFCWRRMSVTIPDGTQCSATRLWRVGGGRCGSSGGSNLDRSHGLIRKNTRRRINRAWSEDDVVGCARIIWSGTGTMVCCCLADDSGNAEDKQGYEPTRVPVAALAVLSQPNVNTTTNSSS